MFVENALAIVVWTPVVVSTVRFATVVARVASAARTVMRLFYRSKDE
jgi:hypothetical protein